jgi:hypothetical protein
LAEGSAARIWSQAGGLLMKLRTCDPLLRSFLKAAYHSDLVDRFGISKLVKKDGRELEAATQC